MQSEFTSKLPPEIPPYTGRTTIPYAEGYAKNALTVYANQLAACNTGTHPSYRYYGAYGIKVEYSRKDFVAWYLHEIKTFIGTRPKVVRLDKEKNFSFDNIRMVSCLT